MTSPSPQRPNPRVETDNLIYEGCGIIARYHISHFNMDQPWENLHMTEDQIKFEADRFFDLLDEKKIDKESFMKKYNIETVEQAAVFGMLQRKVYRDRYFKIGVNANEIA